MLVIDKQNRMRISTFYDSIVIHMPELPEVETSLRGIKPHINHQIIASIHIRQTHLRWPIPANLAAQLKNQRLNDIQRRGKYLLLSFNNGTLIIHLGMSGKLRVLTSDVPAQKHDHVDLVFKPDICLRYTDPRRFGAILFTTDDPLNHPLLKKMGPEPLSRHFTGDYLWERAKGKKTAVKSYVMDSSVVAGVGNIYATEALFAAGIRPDKQAGKVTQTQFIQLAAAIKTILKQAIKKGGTTLNDFTQSDGKPGYFSIELQAYGHAGDPCPRCHKPLKLSRLGQRATVYCSSCQT